jgi:hypothetical protein
MHLTLTHSELNIRSEVCVEYLGMKDAFIGSFIVISYV